MKTIVYKDVAGNEQTIETKNIWGYCQNRSVYINFNKQFNKLHVIGTLCHFTATVATAVGFRDPMGYNSGLNNTIDELQQFVLDSHTNKVLDFSVKNMENLLKGDSALHDQFVVLKKREKNNSVFIYLRKFNEKHPLYLPQ